MQVGDPTKGANAKYLIKKLTSIWSLPEKNTRQTKVTEARKVQRKEVEVEDILMTLVACLCIASVTAQEQKALITGTYVRLHGLNKSL